MRTLGLVLALILTGPALAKSRPPAPGAASIPFANHGGIRDFRSDGTEAIYLQDQANRWYRATLMGSCFDLPFAEAIGYRTNADDSFDRFSSILVRGRSCPLQTLDPSGPPPEKPRHKKK
jgi:hypothetical protein